jgi:hypothetical protein
MCKGGKLEWRLSCTRRNGEHIADERYPSAQIGVRVQVRMDTERGSFPSSGILQLVIHPALVAG